MFAVTLADIQKALIKLDTSKDKEEIETQLRAKLPPEYLGYIDVFNRIKAEELPLIRGKGVDYIIKIEKEDRKEKEVL